MGITETQRRKRRSLIQLPIVTDSETGKINEWWARSLTRTSIFPDASQTRRRTHEPSVNQGIRVSPLKSNGQVIARVRTRGAMRNPPGSPRPPPAVVALEGRRVFCPEAAGSGEVGDHESVVAKQWSLHGEDKVRSSALQPTRRRCAWRA
jgi:hypothetical protein